MCYFILLLSWRYFSIAIGDRRWRLNLTSDSEEATQVSNYQYLIETGNRRRPPSACTHTPTPSRKSDSKRLSERDMMRLLRRLMKPTESLFSIISTLPFVNRWIGWCTHASQMLVNFFLFPFFNFYSIFVIKRIWWSLFRFIFMFITKMTVVYFFSTRSSCRPLYSSDYLVLRFTRCFCSANSSFLEFLFLTRRRNKNSRKDEFAEQKHRVKRRTR
jgi:hypothetical protein